MSLTDVYQSPGHMGMPSHMHGRHCYDEGKEDWKVLAKLTEIEHMVGATRDMVRDIGGVVNGIKECMMMRHACPMDMMPPATPYATPFATPITGTPMTVPPSTYTCPGGGTIAVPSTPTTMPIDTTPFGGMPCPAPFPTTPMPDTSIPPAPMPGPMSPCPGTPLLG
ncbi:MAG: hypothetical protein WBK10_09215 [Bacillota bacterium]|nr:hypothetical protein [Bacillota bacterium]